MKDLYITIVGSLWVVGLTVLALAFSYLLIQDALKIRAERKQMEK